MLPLIAAAVITFVAPTPKPIDVDKLVLAIEERENGKWSSPGGRACWQPETWKQFTKLPYRMASNQWQSRIVMKIALANYSARFTAEGIEPTVWRLATAFRYGFDGAILRARHASDYGELTEGIYGAL